MPTYQCDVCGRRLLFGVPKERIGTREYCPAGESSCHRLGLRSASWTLTQVEARQLLDDAIAAG